MVYAEQLRQGNKLKFEDEIVTVLWITPDGVIIDGIDCNDGSNIILEPERLEYIPLDEKWLERCGFEKIKHISGTVFWIMKKSGGFHLEVHEDFACYGARNVNYPNYMHQLQNLFYALSGQELEIKQEAWRTL